MYVIANSHSPLRLDFGANLLSDYFEQVRHLKILFIFCVNFSICLLHIVGSVSIEWGYAYTHVLTRFDRNLGEDIDQEICV